jgi:hypothetical protein
VPFLQQLFFTFCMIRVRHAGVYRADLGALWRFVVANTLGALVGVDYISSPLEIALFLHSGSQAPQLIQSSVILYAIR